MVCGDSRVNKSLMIAWKWLYSSYRLIVYSPIQEANMLKKFISHFLHGLLVIVPITLTLSIIYFVYTRVASLYLWLVDFNPMKDVPAFAFIILDIFVIALIGYLTTIFIGRPLFEKFERIMYRVPLLRIIYSSLRGITSAVVGEQRKFDQPVAIKFNNSELYKLGFLVQEDLSSLGVTDKVAVYLPNSYNVTGNIALVNKEYVTPLNISGLDLMNFLISGGLVDLTEIRSGSIFNFIDEKK